MGSGLPSVDFPYIDYIDYFDKLYQLYKMNLHRQDRRILLSDIKKENNK